MQKYKLRQNLNLMIFIGYQKFEALSDIKLTKNML